MMEQSTANTPIMEGWCAILQLCTPKIEHETGDLAMGSSQCFRKSTQTLKPDYGIPTRLRDHVDFLTGDTKRPNKKE